MIDLDDPTAPDLFTLVEGYGHRHGVSASPDRLLLGVELADGGVATNAGPEPDRDDAPRLGDRGGHGGGRSVDKTLWLTPVPPDGDVVVVCACEALGVPETRVVIPAAALARYTSEWEESSRLAKERTEELESLRSANASLTTRVRGLEERRLEVHG